MMLLKSCRSFSQKKLTRPCIRLRIRAFSAKPELASEPTPQEKNLQDKSGLGEASRFPEVDEQGQPFRKLLIMPKPDERAVKTKRIDKSKMEVRPPRWTRMSVEQDWPSVWPTAASFRASAVPLPVRMGYRTKPRLYSPPGKHANLELMKIPNFLHLTPNAIQRHCEAIKQFRTPWPSALQTEEDCEKYFPLSVTTCDYCHAGPSLRDVRSRIVTVQVKVSSLKLDRHARDKLLRLVGDKYNVKTDVLTIVTDRCPARKQNMDYTMYVLTVLYKESWKLESWEKEMSDYDIERFNLSDCDSEKNLISTLRATQAACEKLKSKEAQDSREALEKEREIENKFIDFYKNLNKDISDQELLNLAEVIEHAAVWDAYRNEEETADSVRSYGKSVRKLLGIPSLDESV